MKVANYGLGGLYTVHYDQVLMGADPRSREARQVFNVVAGDRITTVFNTFLKYIKEDINNALSDQNAIIPEKIRDECSNKFKNIPNFNIPDICGSVEHTVIYNRI